MDEEELKDLAAQADALGMESLTEDQQYLLLKGLNDNGTDAD